MTTLLAFSATINRVNEFVFIIFLIACLDVAFVLGLCIFSLRLGQAQSILCGFSVKQLHSLLESLSSCGLVTNGQCPLDTRANSFTSHHCGNMCQPTAQSRNLVFGILCILAPFKARFLFFFVIAS